MILNVGNHATALVVIELEVDGRTEWRAVADRGIEEFEAGVKQAEAVGDHAAVVLVSAASAVVSLVIAPVDAVATEDRFRLLITDSRKAFRHGNRSPRLRNSYWTAS